MTNNDDPSWTSDMCYNPPLEEYNVLDDTYLIDSESNEKGWKLSNHYWCKYCNTVYSKQCEHDIIDIMNKENKNLMNTVKINYDLFAVDKYDMNFLNILSSYVDELVKESNKNIANLKSKNKNEVHNSQKKLSKLKDVLDFINEKVSKCSLLRENHHKHCSVNIFDLSLKRGDSSHRQRIDSLNHIASKSKKMSNKIKKTDDSKLNFKIYKGSRISPKKR